MVEIKVQASDSAAAMEEVEKRLGSDALIVSTTKVDGKIEIVATNDDPSNYQKQSEPLILDSEHRVTKFADVLVPKIEGADKNEANGKNDFQQPTVKESIQNIKAELQKIEKLSDEDIRSERSFDKKSISTCSNRLFVQNVVELLNENAPEKSLETMAKSLSKILLMVNFEDSDLFLVIERHFWKIGIFKKTLTHMENKEDIKDCQNIECEIWP